MLPAGKEANEVFVVDQTLLRAEKKRGGKRRAETDADGRLTARRPGVERTQASGGPIRAAHERPHLAGVGEPRHRVMATMGEEDSAEPRLVTRESLSRRARPH